MGRIGSTAVALLATLLSPPAAPRNPPERGAIAPVADRRGQRRAPLSGSRPGRAASGCAPGWGPTADELDRAARLVARLRLPELAGQVIVADWRGTGAPDRDGPAPAPGRGHRLLRQRRVDAPDPVRQRPAPPDRRLARGRSSWPSTRRAASSSGCAAAPPASRPSCPRGPRTTSASPGPRPRASGAELRGLGFTVDFAPDADVTSGPADPTIGSRSVGSDPDLVAEHVVAAAQGYLDAGCCRSSSTSPATAPCRPTATGPAGPVADPARPAPGRPGAVPRRGRRGPPGRHGRPPRRPGRRPAGPLVAVPEGRHRPAAPRPGLRRAGRHRLPGDGARSAGAGRRASRCRPCGPGTTWR